MSSSATNSHVSGSRKKLVTFQDRVEEQREFLRLRFEVVAVAGICLDPGRLHAFLDASDQTGPFVRPEIEAAAAPQVFEQLLEFCRATLLDVHPRCPFVTSWVNAAATAPSGSTKSTAPV